MSRTIGLALGRLLKGATVQHLAVEVSWATGLSAVGAVTTPFAVAVVGYVVSRQLKALEARQWRSQELIAARLGFYREIAEPLNDLMCYFTFIGRWKELTPPDVVALKRSLDKTFHTLSPFFSRDVERSYNEFMDLCFDTFGSWGADARLKTSCRRRQAVKSEEWLSSWNAMFAYEADEGCRRMSWNGSRTRTTRCWRGSLVISSSRTLERITPLRRSS